MPHILGRVGVAKFRPRSCSVLVTPQFYSRLHGAEQNLAGGFDREGPVSWIGVSTNHLPTGITSALHVPVIHRCSNLVPSMDGTFALSS
jgi:hypothetical protein